MKVVLGVLLGLGALGVAAGGYFVLKLGDRHRGYDIDLHISGKPPGELHIGFGAVTITPAIPDTWRDANGDGRYFEGDGDTFDDGNGNGRFDPVWMAGFANRRPANGVHDDLWARAMVIDDGSTRLAIVALDAIGYGSDDVIAVRKAIPESAGIDYCIVTSSHTHEAPDLIGIWGEGRFKSGVDPAYLDLVMRGAVDAVIAASSSMKPAWLRVAQDLTSAARLVEDSRLPEVTDPGVRMIQAIALDDSTTLGTLFSWANHPEVLWDRNLLITSDFVHYVREFTENGVVDADSVIVPGLGGTTVYVNGAIGGLMTISPGFEVTDPVTGVGFTEPSFQKAEAVGKNLAMIGLAALDGADVHTVTRASISLRAKSIEMELANPLFRLAALVGVIDRGMTGWFKMRSEVAYWTLGPMSFVHMPGEIYPEIVNGGVEAPAGQDFAVEPLEVPPLRSVMPGKYKFVVGVSNDMIGYIIPKSQWDDDDTPTYGYDESPYGEINSIGPETAPKLHGALLDMITNR